MRAGQFDRPLVRRFVVTKPITFAVDLRPTGFPTCELVLYY